MDEASFVIDEGWRGDLAFRLTEGRDSDCLVAVFSQVRVPAGKFGLERLFARTRHACLFLNQPDNKWYRGTAAAIDELIGRAQERLPGRRLILYGSSMGAYGVLATAARWREARAYAFAPDFRIGEPCSQSSAAGLTAERGDADIGTFLREPRTGVIHVVFGLFDPYDAGVAARLSGNPLSKQVNLVTLASSHELHDHLYSLNVIRKVIATFGRDLAAEADFRGLRLAMDDVGSYLRFAALAAELASGRCPPLSAWDSLALGANPGLELLKAETAEASGHPDISLHILERLDKSIEADARLAGLPKRYLKEVPRRRIRLLCGLGRREAAAALARAALERFPSDAGFAAAISAPSPS